MVQETNIIEVENSIKNNEHKGLKEKKADRVNKINQLNYIIDLHYRSPILIVRVIHYRQEFTFRIPHIQKQYFASIKFVLLSLLI